MAYTQAQPASKTVFLSLSGSPATSITYDIVTAKYAKYGQTAYTVKTLASADWVNLGGGVYRINFSALEMDTVGDFTFTLSSVSFNNFTFEEFTIEPLIIVNPVILPSQCVVSGSIFNQSAFPPRDLRIVASPVNFPAKDGGSIIASDEVYTSPDSQGNWQLTLIRNSVVIIKIERCGINTQITVPNSPTANLVDLLPPFVIDYSQPS